MKNFNIGDKVKTVFSGYAVKRHSVGIVVSLTSRNDMIIVDFETVKGKLVNVKDVVKVK